MRTGKIATVNQICKLREEANIVKDRIKDKITKDDTCCLCGRKAGDECIIPATTSRVNRIKMKCKISFHIVPSITQDVSVVKLCDQCHFEYHFFEYIVDKK